MAAAIEQNHDDRGIMFPPAIAPFDMIIVPVKIKDEEIKAAALKTYEEMKSKGFDVLIDDRDSSFGSKLADADLLGIPVRVVVGDKTTKENLVEIKSRWNPEVNIVKIEDLAEHAKKNSDSGNSRTGSLKCHTSTS